MFLHLSLQELPFFLHFSPVSLPQCQVFGDFLTVTEGLTRAACDQSQPKLKKPPLTPVSGWRGGGQQEDGHQDEVWAEGHKEKAGRLWNGEGENTRTAGALTWGEAGSRRFRETGFLDRKLSLADVGAKPRNPARGPLPGQRVGNELVEAG